MLYVINIYIYYTTHAHTYTHIYICAYNKICIIRGVVIHAINAQVRGQHYLYSMVYCATSFTTCCLASGMEQDLLLVCRPSSPC